MPHSRYFLAIDLGAESGRVMLAQFDGERIELTQMRRFSNGPVRLPIVGEKSARLHWDVLRLWTEIKEGIAQAVRQTGKELASIGIDTWGVDFALLDHQGALISNPYYYRDSRTDGMLDEAFRRMSRERIFELTGIQFMQINTLYQLLSMVVSHSPSLDVAETFLTMPDLFNYWMSGEIASEFSIATTTQCYDPRQRNWSDPLLSAMGIPRRIFPRVIAPGTVLGPLLPAVTEDTLAEKIPVVAPACHDTGSAVVAVPAETKDFAWISSGTWSIMGTELSAPVINPASLKFNLTNEGGANGTFRLSKNVAGLWLVQECRRTWAAAGDELSYEKLTEIAAQAKPLVSVIDPDHGDFLKPGDMPSRIRAFCQRSGQPVPETKVAVVRCILESLALKYRWVLERLEQVVGHRLDPIHIVGGGTQNRLLSQLTADATGRQVIAGPIEATALGNVVMQGIALGHIGSLQQARAIVRRSSELSVFQPADRAGWDDAYARLLNLMTEVEK